MAKGIYSLEEVEQALGEYCKNLLAMYPPDKVVDYREHERLVYGLLPIYDMKPEDWEEQYAERKDAK